MPFRFINNEKETPPKHCLNPTKTDKHTHTHTQAHTPTIPVDLSVASSMPATTISITTSACFLLKPACSNDCVTRYVSKETNALLGPRREEGVPVPPLPVTEDEEEEEGVENRVEADPPPAAAEGVRRGEVEE